MSSFKIPQSTASTTTPGFNFGTAASQVAPAQGINFGTAASPAALAPGGPTTAAPAMNFGVPGGTGFSMTPTAGTLTSAAPAISASSTVPGINFAVPQPSLGAPSAITSAATLAVAPPVASAPAATSLPAAAAPAAFSGFFSQTTSAAPALTALSTAATAASSAPTLPSLTAGTSSTNTGAAAATALKIVSSAQPTSLTTATTTSSAGVSSGGNNTGGGGQSLSVRALEERINKWMVEVKEQEGRFISQATNVNAWDKLLQNSADQISNLHDSLKRVKNDQSALQTELEFISGQQTELESLLGPLEAAVATSPPTHQGDVERDHLYQMAQTMDGQLRRMTEDLRDIIEHVNANNSGAASAASAAQAHDPVGVIARILSVHMDSLKWVDQNASLLSQKLDEVSKVAEAKRREASQARIPY